MGKVVTQQTGEVALYTNNILGHVSRTINQSLRSPGKTFANLFRQDESMQKPTVIDDFLKLANLFLTPEELPLEQISNFLSEYKNMSQHEAKSEFLRLLNKVNIKYVP